MPVTVGGLAAAAGAPSKRTTTAVLVEYGDRFDPVTSGWVDDACARTVLGVHCVPDPRLDVSLPKIGGTVRQDRAWFELDDEYELIGRLGSGMPHSPVAVRIAELQRDWLEMDTWTLGGQALPYVHTLWCGPAAKVTRNPRNRGRGRVRVHVESPLAELRRATTGVRATQGCDHVLYGPGCEVASLGFAVFGVKLDAVTGKIATFSGGSKSIPNQPSGWFVDGWWQLEGARVRIEDWRQGQSTMVMSRQLPKWMIGKTGTLFAGCDRSDTTCGARFGNRERWGAYGALMRDHNPMLELTS